ncbi:DNA cytosine methyltransferase [Mycobacterium seoulense]|uniref:DNA cytosine methyltransferase n=1 Tax=Mycobacterium seoulense TaxID=386911 RepID=UPI003CF00035
MIRVAGLFAGIGGIELGFHEALGDGVETLLLCESWDAAQSVLEKQFPGAEIHPDVRYLKKLPSGVDVLTAGFPCTDLSQAGRTAGISGSASGLVAHLFEVLRATRASRRPWLLIENVSNMLVLDKGRAMAYLIHELESLGYRWAYRLVDSRFTGVPQRRRRVILLASVEHDPRTVLFADDAGERDEDELAHDAFGFYWTEGARGLGWAVDAVPTLKGGSTVGIPSPPAIWHPGGAPGQRFVKPSISEAEELQGFPSGWTDVFQDSVRRNGPRWKLVGNAVTVGVSRWVASRIAEPGDPINEEEMWESAARWPSAAWGEDGKRVRVAVSEFPVHEPYRHLLDVVDIGTAEVLSRRALAGFWSRLSEGNLGRHPGFREQIVMELESALA